MIDQPNVFGSIVKMGFTNWILHKRIWKLGSYLLIVRCLQRPYKLQKNTILRFIDM
jgi:hypothetical protein